MTEIVKCDNLTKFYKRRKKSGSWMNPLKWSNYSVEAIQGVKDFNFSIYKGEKVGLIGPNGAGKSTFIKLLTGIIHPTRGSIRLFNLDPFKYRKLCSNNYGVVFGNRQMLWNHVPVIESFKLAADIYQINKETLEERIQFFDKSLDIAKLLHVPPRKLSFGQRMKCQIVYSLLHLPQIVLLDEATIGLDIIVRHKIIQLLNQLVEEQGLTLIITSHLIEDVEKLADRLILIDTAEIQFDGSKDEFIKKYGHMRLIKTTFSDALDKQPKSILEKLTEDLEINHNSIKINCDKNEVQGIIKVISQLPNIEDITVSEPSLEMILREFFERGNNNG